MGTAMRRAAVVAWAALVLLGPAAGVASAADGGPTPTRPAAGGFAGNAEIESVSCASAGNCSAGGGYASSLGIPRAYVVGEVRGTWGTAREVPAP